MARDWHYTFGDGTNRGPVSAAEIKQLADSGQLPATTHIWTSGMVQWAPLAELRNLVAQHEPAAAVFGASNPAIGPTSPASAATMGMGSRPGLGSGLSAGVGPTSPGASPRTGLSPTAIGSGSSAGLGISTSGTATPGISTPSNSTPGISTSSPSPTVTDGLAAVAGQTNRPLGAAAAKVKALFEKIDNEIRKVFVGQNELVLGALTALFSSGHVLIESVPGLGKTLFVRTLGRALGLQFGRIQFTADLMPSDITGAQIFDMKTQDFRFRPGPVFTNLLLADEINRAPAKTHAALLEIMQEYRVTVETTSHKLVRPFLVLATQNPIESEGTYNLPEAQLDRFMFKLIADYPSAQDEAQILKMHSLQIDLDQRLLSDVKTVSTPEEILEVTRLCGDVRVDDKLIYYVNNLVRLTRQWPQLHMGASPRAGIALLQGARTLAAFYGRDYVVPDDVVQIALPALRHRVILTAEAEVEGRRVDELLTELIRSVEVPRL